MPEKPQTQEKVRTSVYLYKALLKKAEALQKKRFLGSLSALLNQLLKEAE